MKTLQINLPDNIAERFEKLAVAQGEDYASVNTTEVTGRDALFADLLVLGLDEIEAGAAQFPDSDN